MQRNQIYPRFLVFRGKRYSNFHCSFASIHPSIEGNIQFRSRETTDLTITCRWLIPRDLRLIAGLRDVLERHPHLCSRARPLRATLSTEFDGHPPKVRTSSNRSQLEALVHDEDPSVARSRMWTPSPATTSRSLHLPCRYAYRRELTQQAS
jgi:hypothetical protein